MRLERERNDGEAQEKVQQRGGPHGESSFESIIASTDLTIGLFEPINLKQRVVLPPEQNVGTVSGSSKRSAGQTPASIGWKTNLINDQAGNAPMPKELDGHVYSGVSMTPKFLFEVAQRCEARYFSLAHVGRCDELTRLCRNGACGTL